MEKATTADYLLLTPCVPERAESQTLDPDAKNLQPPSSLGPATTAPTLASPTPGALLLQRQPSSQGFAVSALQSKIKALSERHMAAGSEAFEVGVNKKASPVASSLFSPVLVSWGSSSSDDDADSQCSTFRPVVPDSPVEGLDVAGLDLCLGALPRGLGEGSSLENLSDVSASASSLEDNFSWASAAKPWASPEGLWKATGPEALLQTGDTPPAPGTPQMGKAQRQGGIRRDLLRRDSLEALRGCLGELGSQRQVGGLWRPDSLDSMCSSGSSISLAERVEMNRGLLKQMLNKSQGPEPGAKTTVDKEQRAEEVAQCNEQGFIALNDSDWDSGISLQDSEHSKRAFVSSEDLPLSPRHEQAKRLLERARMKARSFPLKADHTILPPQRDAPEQLSLVGASLHRALLAGKGVASVSSVTVPAVTTLSGNLSDSSSGDSACAPRRRRGPSPTRVRFEDESEKDAEVRYLERLRQRRRAGERAQGLLISKPSLSSYVNGRRDTDSANGKVIERGRCPESASLWHTGPRAQGACLNGGSKGRLKALAAQEALNMQCNSCGTFLEGGNPTPNRHANPSTGSGQNSWLNDEGKEPGRTLRTELIKETYIGKVTPGEVADGDRIATSSAGGTDTSGSVQAMKVRRRSRRGEILCTNGHGGRVTVSPTPPPPRPNHSLPPVSSSNHSMAPVSSSNHSMAPVSSSNHSMAPVSSSNGFVVVPPNPYAIEQVSNVVGLPIHSPAPPHKNTNSPPCLKGIPSPPSALPIKSALKTGPKSRPNGQRPVKPTPSTQHHFVPQDSLEDQERGAPPSPQIERPIGVNHGVEVASLGLTSITGTTAPCIRHASLLKTPPSPAGTTVGKMGNPEPEAPVEQHHLGMGELSLERSSIITPPPYRSGGNGRVRGPMRAEHQREDSPSPTQRVGTEDEQREGRPKLSLRRFFSAFGLNGVGKLGKGRSSSMEQLSIQPRGNPPASSGPSSTSSPGSSPAQPESNQLRKAPSLQSLRMGSPFMQLRKSSSVQNLQSWKKGDRSSAYKPGDQPRSPALSRGLQRALSVEDVGGPSGMRSVGRVAQAFPDGTFLLELSRPPDGPFGFLISRGKGRPDSGVYVEEMCDSSTEKLYAGLLGVGDELLEVNGEKVAGLSLDLVTHLMTQGGVTSVRVLRHRRPPPPR
ncbi:uncharacterized protein KIAA1614 isoform X2 [Esox lucius]|uniref:PDZ domain-containing protein n=1 Tax=Esox lucius TaxID=8010 RepID=A0A3P8XBK1_ESOLU|nr:uncharacterized protein KIAA1614 isoform X2 [Esox lucius]